MERIIRTERRGELLRLINRPRVRAAAVWTRRRRHQSTLPRPDHA